MHKHHAGWIIGLPALLALAACQTPQKSGMSLKITPTSTVTHGAEAASASYAIGRYYQGQIRYDQAIEAYRKTLAINPTHADAYNGLGLIFAAQGKLDAAISEFEQAVALAPSLPKFRNNLGYALLQRGNARAAMKTLEAAREIEPTNQRILENLQLALEHSRQPEENTSDARLAELPKTVISAPSLDSPSTLETQDRATAPPATFRLEISNGNGVTGLAKRMSSMFGNAADTRARLTNHKPYDIARSEIQYRPGHEAQALAVTRYLPHSTPLVASTNLRSDIQVRLLLGQDIREVPKAVRPLDAAATLSRSKDTPET